MIQPARSQISRSRPWATCDALQLNTYRAAFGTTSRVLGRENARSYRAKEAALKWRIYRKRDRGRLPPFQLTIGPAGVVASITYEAPEWLCDNLVCSIRGRFILLSAFDIYAIFNT